MALPPGFVLEEPRVNLPQGFVLEQAPPEKQSAFRQVADVPLGIAKGAVQGVRMIADAFGAGSDTSNTIKSAETYLADLMSAQSKNDQQEISRIMKDAEDKGVLDQVKAAVKAFTIAPVDTLSSALGTAAPVIVGALGAKVLGAGALVSTGVSALTGAGMGAGVVKGSIYEETKRTLKEAGASEQDAEARAKLAQEYGGKNLDQILLGTVLGGAAAVGPLEKGAAGILARRILGKTEGAETVAGQAAKGALRRRAEAGLLEAVPEAVQAGQEQVAQNIALQREGFDVPTFRGAVSSATLEAIAGAGLGAALGGGKPTPEAPAPEAPPVAPPSVAPEVEPEKPMITRVMNMASQQNGYGLLEQQKQRLLAEPQTEDIKKELTFIQEIQDRMNIETAQRLTPSGKSPFTITPDALTELGIKPTAPIIKRINGKAYDDPYVIEQLEKFAANKNVAPEVQQSVLAFVEQLRQPVEPPAPPVSEAPPAEPVAPTVTLPAPSVEPVAEAVEPPAPPVAPPAEPPAPPVEPAPVVEAAAPVAEAPAETPVAPPAPESDQKALEEKRQMVADMIETKKANREAVPEAWIKKLADLSAQLRGETISEGETYSMEVAGHPLFDGPPVLRNLIPIKVKDSDAAQRALDRALDLEKQFATEFYGAKQALKSARTAAEKKAAQARIKKLNDQGWDEDALQTLRNETIQELSRLVDVTQKAAPKADAPVTPVANVEEQTTPTEEAKDIAEPTIRNRLKAIAKNLGVLVFETGDKYSSGNGVVNIPTEDKQVEGAQSPEHVFAHELGHAILQNRSMSFNGMPNAEVAKWIDGWDGIKAISKAFRPEIHTHKLPKFRRHANKPDEIIADSLGSFLLGISSKQDIAPLIKALNLNDFDLGIKERTSAAPAAPKAEAPAVEAPAPAAEAPAQPTNDRRRTAAENVRKATVKRTNANSAMVWQIIGPDGEVMSGPPGVYPGREGPLAGSATMGNRGWKTKREADAALAYLNQKANEVLGSEPAAKPAQDKKSLGSAQAQQSNFEQTLRTLLNKFGLKDVGLSIIEGMQDAGSYAQQLIRIADRADNPVRTLRHEAIHALRELGFFTDAQWKSLSKMAKDKWIDQYLKQRNIDGKPLKAGEESRYDAYMREYNGDMEKITEEAVADAFADFDASKPPAGLLQALLKRMKDLFQSIKSALTKVESVDQIFGKVEEGKLKPGEKAESGERKSVRDRATANFRRWFGDSKVVDEKGEPLVVYHGTDEEFTVFDKKKMREGRYGKRFYFADTPERAKAYGKNVMPVYLRITNPGFGGDGLIAGSEVGNRIYMVFEPTQIKSAIGNNGDYSLTNADIRKSIGGRNPGEQAISIVNSLGMGVKPPEPGRFEKAKKMLKDAEENPSLTKESAKKTLTKWLDWFETTVFSSDSAFNNKIRRGIISDFKQNPEVLGMLLEASQSQTVHADALASQFMIDGGLQYNDDLKKWESVKKDDNFVALAKKIEDLAKKYNVTKDEMERIAHTYFVAKRLPGIIKRNEELDAEIKAERATAKPDRKQIEEWESLKVFVSDEQLAMMEPGLSLVKTIPELKEVVDIWQGIRKNNIDVMVNSGLWSPEYANAMWDNMDYVPYYREEQLEEGAGPQEFIRGLQVKSKEFQLKGSGAAVNDVFDNMIRWSQYAMNRAIRAHKATQMIDAALKIDVDGKPMATKVTEQKRGMNIVRAFRDGKQELYDMADPLFVPAFSAIQNVSIPTLTFMSKLANVLRQSVVLYPLFSVAQVPQDSFAAMFSSGLKTQHALKIPYLAVKEFIKTLSKTSQTHNELKRFGVVGVRDFSATVIRDDAEIYAGLRPPKGGWGKTKEFLEHIAMSADNAVRQAVYEASMQQGLNKSEALEKAFEIINFRRRGTSKMLNVMGQTVPFFYAYLSAQRVAYKVLTGVGISPTDRAEAGKTLAMTSAAVATLSMLYAMANGDDEDYMETPANIRDRTLTIPGSGGVRIPLRPDFFLFPKIIAEHTYLLLAEKGYQDAAKFKTSMKDALFSAIASPTPFPTAIKPAIEVAINYDFFQGKPLIGNFEKQKDLDRQFRDSTSEFAKLLGQTGMISPIAADHMIRGMFGSFGGLFLFGTNQFLHSDPDVPRPEMNATEMLAALPGTSGLLKRPQESALKNDFYTLRDEVEKAVNTFNDIKTRSPEGIEAFLADEKQMARLMLGKPVDKINRELSKIRRQITIITNMPESQMSAADKADYKRQLMELEREILRSVNVKELREMAKI